MFRFTIRDVLWLTVVVTLGIAWLISNRDLRHRLQRTASELQQIEEQNRVLHAEAIATARLEAGPVLFGEPDPNAPGVSAVTLP